MINFVELFLKYSLKSYAKCCLSALEKMPGLLDFGSFFFLVVYASHVVFFHVREFPECSFHTLIIGLRVTDKEDLCLVFLACFFFKPQTEELQMPGAPNVNFRKTSVRKTI